MSRLRNKIEAAASIKPRPFWDMLILSTPLGRVAVCRDEVYDKVLEWISLPVYSLSEVQKMRGLTAEVKASLNEIAKKRFIGKIEAVRGRMPSIDTQS